LILALPGLLASRKSGAAPVNAQHLARLLANGGAPVHEGDELGEALAPRYSVARQADWPLASIRIAHAGVDPQDAFWFTADPVTLAVGRDDVRLEGVVRDLTRSEAHALTTTLNVHFESDGLTFIAPSPDAFFVRSNTHFQVTTRAPAAAARSALSSLLPQGPDGDLWRRWQSEMQMLLHDHPVNVARESAGRTVANSVWFSAGGTRPVPPSPPPSIRTWSNGGIAAALASHIGAPALPIPERFALVRPDNDIETLVIAFDAPLDEHVVETLWATPIEAALAAGKLQSVSILADGAGRAVSWRALRPPLLQRITDRFASRDLAALLIAAGEER